MASSALLWTLGLACVIVAIIGAAVKVAGIELPAAVARPARVGVLVVGLLSLLLGTVLFLDHGPGPVAGDTASARLSTTGAVHADASGEPGPADGSAAADVVGTDPPVDADSVLWHGQLRLSDGQGVDVGRLPVTVDLTGATSFWEYQGQALSGQDGDNLLSEWTGPGDPTVRQCAVQLRTQPTERVRGYRAGLRLCTHGLFDKRIAYARVLSYDGESSQVEVTIWAQQLTP